MQLDALREIANIGTGHAATSLSAMLQQQVDMSVPSIFIIPFDRVASVVGNVDSPHAVVFLKVEGQITGKAIFAFSLESAENAIKKLFNLDVPVDLYENDMYQSALKELGNIMVGSFISAIVSFTGLSMQASVPALAIDMIGAITDAILLEDGFVSDEVVFVDTQLSGVSEIGGKFILLPDDGALTKIWEALGI